MENDNQFRGFTLFNDIENADVQAWNRMQMYLNIFKDHSREMADAYIRQIDEVSRKRMQKMQETIKEEGYSVVQRRIQEAV